MLMHSARHGLSSLSGNGLKVKSPCGAFQWTSMPSLPCTVSEAVHAARQAVLSADSSKALADSSLLLLMQVTNIFMLHAAAIVLHTLIKCPLQMRSQRCSCQFLYNSAQMIMQTPSGVKHTAILGFFLQSFRADVSMTLNRRKAAQTQLLQRPCCSACTCWSPQLWACTIPPGRPRCLQSKAHAQQPGHHRNRCL